MTACGRVLFIALLDSRFRVRMARTVNVEEFEFPLFSDSGSTHSA